jgi:predicted GTPase
MAGVLIINKMETAPPEGIDAIRRNIEAINPNALVIEAASPIFVDDPKMIKGKRVLVIEDGPTLTHGEMTYGAGIIAAKKYGAAEIIDPRPYAVDSIRETYQKYPDIGILLPAMGYGAKQVNDLQDTINSVDCDTLIIATPIDLSRIAKITKPTVRVKYELQEIGTPNLFDVLANCDPL